MKLCNKCEIIKDDECFYLIKNGTKLHSLCKLCCSIKNKENNKNRDKSKKQLYNVGYYSENKVKISLQNREQKNNYQKEYYQLNKDKIFENEKVRYQTDIQFRLSKIYRNRLNSYIKGENDNIKYLKCSLIELQNFIEIQFENNMNWDNRSDIWELDHIIPISKFNLENQIHKETCFHWCNLKPILKSDNRQKSNKLFEDIIKTHHEFTLHYSKLHNLDYIDIYEFYIQNFNK